ncbi:hypothetical protein [Streptomyces sp. WZ-12]|nr:hypothetical protein [Streptomyces sp. WZ-12]
MRPIVGDSAGVLNDSRMGAGRVVEGEIVFLQRAQNVAELVIE